MRLALFAAAMASVSTGALAQTYQRTDTDIVVTPAQRPQAAVRLQVYGDQIIRVTETPTRKLDVPASLSSLLAARTGRAALVASWRADHPS